MDTLYPRCAGIDVHKNHVVVAIRCQQGAAKIHEEVRTLATMAADLLALSDWLAEHGVTHVAMESTGVSWKPVFNILEGRFAVMLVNAEHIKQVPGRKTDVKDCRWIAQLLQHGLLKASFVPPTPIRELRDLTRQRAQLIGEKVSAVNGIRKVLEDANLKLASVATDVLGSSGRDMLEALIAGETDAEKLADLARLRLREKIPALRRALQGRVSPSTPAADAAGSPVTFHAGLGNAHFNSPTSSTFLGGPKATFHLDSSRKRFSEKSSRRVITYGVS